MTSRGEAIDAVLRHHAKLGRLDYDTMVLEQPKPKPPPKEYTLQRRAKTAADSALPAATRFHPLPPAASCLAHAVVDLCVRGSWCVFAPVLPPCHSSEEHAAACGSDAAARGCEACMDGSVRLLWQRWRHERDAAVHGLR